MIESRSDFNPPALASYPEVAPDEVVEMMSAMPSGAELEGTGSVERGDELIFGIFPKMDALFGWAVSAVSELMGKNQKDVLVMECGPGRALASMVSWARAGVNVMWREIHEPRRLQTEAELRKLPESIRKKITYVPKDEKPNPDIVVWNYPQHSVKPSEMVVELVRGDECEEAKNFGGFFIVQTEVPERIVFDDDGKMELMIDLPANSGEYVMSSAYSFVGANSVGSTLRAYKVSK